MLQDALNDAMVTIRNAEAAGKAECMIRPASKLIGRVLKVMQESEYIRSFELIEDGRGNLYRVALVGSINNCGVIKPRFAVRRTELEKWEVLGRQVTGFPLLRGSRCGGRSSRSGKPITCRPRTSACSS